MLTSRIGPLGEDSRARWGGVVSVLVFRFALLAALAFLGVWIFRHARHRFADGFWAFLAALCIPLLLLGGLWLGREALRRWNDLRAVGRLIRGEAPRAGAWEAVAGTARAASPAEPFAAPLSGRPALACRYRVFEHSLKTGSRGRKLLRFEGFHLVPTHIDGTRGRIRLRAFPDVRTLEKSPLDSEPFAIEETALHGPVGPWRWAKKASIFSSELERMSYDWRYGPPGPRGSLESIEWILEPGAAVCLAGTWGKDGSSLLPRRTRTAGLPVYAGTAEAVRAALRSEIPVFAGLSAALIGVAGAWAAFVV